MDLSAGDFCGDQRIITLISGLAHGKRRLAVLYTRLDQGQLCQIEGCHTWMKLHVNHCTSVDKRRQDLSSFNTSLITSSTVMPGPAMI